MTDMTLEQAEFIANSPSDFSWEEITMKRITDDYEPTLQRWLDEALALLAVEARDHENNAQLDKEKRANIARTLRAFIAQAAKATTA